MCRPSTPSDVHVPAAGAAAAAGGRGGQGDAPAETQGRERLLLGHAAGGVLLGRGTPSEMGTLRKRPRP